MLSGERLGFRIAFHGSSVGGPDSAFHGTRHYGIQSLIDKLKTHETTPSQETRNKAVVLLQELIDSAEVTDGDVAEHVHLRQEINDLLPKKFEIKDKDLDYVRTADEARNTSRKANRRLNKRGSKVGNPYR